MISNLAKLLKTQQRAEKKQKQEPKPKALPKKQPVTVNVISKNIIEKKAYDEFMRQVVDTPVDDLEKVTKSFIDSELDFYQRTTRERFFFGRSGVLNLLSPSDYKQFAKEYVEQPTQRIYRRNVNGQIQEIKEEIPKLSIKEFTEKYMKRPDIIRSVEQKSAVEEEIVVEDPGISDKPIPKIKPRKKRSIIFLGRDKKDSETSEVQDKGPAEWLKKCIRELRKGPWFNNNLVGTYISPVDGVFGEGEFWKRKEGIKEIINGKEVTLYPATNKFFEILCRHQSGNSVQQSNIMVIPRKNHRWYVVYLVKDGQDVNQVLRDQKLSVMIANWYKDTNSSREEKIEKLLKDPVNDILKQSGASRLESALFQITLDPDYSKTFAEKISNNVAADKENGDEYADRIAFLMAYIGDKGANVLRSRIKEQWYTASAFVDLTPKQLFPEANTTGNNATTLLLRQERNKKDLAELYYQRTYPTDRVPTRPIQPMFSKIDTHEWREKCDNSEQIVSTPDGQLVPYEEGGKVYCFDIVFIQNALKRSGTVKNPVTGKNLRSDFIKFVKNTFAEKHDGESKMAMPMEMSEDEENGEDVDEDEILAPGLMDLVRNNIEACTQQLNDGNLNESGKCNAIENEEIKTTEPEDDDDDDDGENDDEEPEDDGELFLSSSSDDDTTSSSSDDDTTSSSSDDDSDYATSNEDENCECICSRSGRTCAKCKTQISGEPLKTIEEIDNKYKTKKFCNAECLEKYNM